MSDMLRTYGIPAGFLRRARSQAVAFKNDLEPMTLRRWAEMAALTLSAVAIAFCILLGLGYGLTAMELI